MSKITDPSYAGIPAALASKKQWIVWKLSERIKKDGTTKLDKTPFSAKTGIKGGLTSPQDWVTLDKAFEAYILDGFTGIGFCFTKGDGLFGIDLDKCFEDDGSLKPDAQTIVSTMKGTYIEKSVSGTGLHIIGFGKLPGPCHANHKIGVEMYDENRYFTITGVVFDGNTTVTDKQNELELVYHRFFSGDQTERKTATSLDLDDTAEIITIDEAPVDDAMKALVKTGEGSEKWDNDRSNILLRVCQELNQLGVNKESILSILTTKGNWLAEAALNRRGNVESAKEWVWNYTLFNVIEDYKEKVALFDELEEMTGGIEGDDDLEKPIETVNADNQIEYVDDEDAREEAAFLKKIKQPFGFKDKEHELNAAIFTSKVIPIVRSNKQYLYYTGTYWKPASDEFIESRVHRSMFNKNFPISLVNNTITTVKRMSNRNNFKTNKNILNFANGCISIRGWETGKLDMKLMPHDKKHNAIGIANYNFDPEADCPRFKKFINDVTNGDKQAQLLIAQWMGYVLVPECHKYQKALYLVGKSGSGKSTLLSIIQAIVGTTNCVGTSFSNLSGQHGLAALQFKKLAIIADAHQARPDGINRVKEVLLNTIAGDPQMINPKGKDEFSTVVSARFTLAANDPPRFMDEFGALARRFMILVFDTSFVGREDPNLYRNIIENELPGILNFALDGLLKLAKLRGFVKVDNSRLKEEEMEMINNHVGFFMKKYVIETGQPEDRIAKSDIYDKYLMFTTSINQMHHDQVRFSRRFKDHVKQVKEGRLKEDRRKCWIGVKFNEKEFKEHLEDNDAF